MDWNRYISKNLELFYFYAFLYCKSKEAANTIVSDTVYYLLDKDPQKVRYPNSYIKKIMYRKFATYIKKKITKRDREISLDKVYDLRIQYKNRKLVVRGFMDRILEEKVLIHPWEFQMLNLRIEGYTPSELVGSKVFTKGQVEMFNRRIRKYKQKVKNV
jgi:transcriptional regulator